MEFLVLQFPPIFQYVSSLKHKYLSQHLVLEKKKLSLRSSHNARDHILLPNRTTEKGTDD